MNRAGSGDRRKLVFVNRYFDPDDSATSQMLTDLARGLAERGFDVQVVCSRQLYTDANARLPASETRSRVKVRRVATTRFGRAGLLGRAIDYASFYFSAGTTLLTMLGRGDVLIAKTDPPLTSILAAFVARAKRSQLVNWQQDVYPEIASHLGVSPVPSWLDAWVRRLRDWSMRAARMNVLIGSRMLEHFRGRRIPAERLCVIENWADGRAIRPKSARESALRQRLGLVQRFVVGYSGNLGRAHEYRTLLAAATTLRSEESVVFLMIGGGANMEPLRHQAEALGLENMRFLPYQPREELEDSLAAADVHLASLRPDLEGLIMPSKLYGILAAGRPVVFVGDPDGEIARVIGAARCGITVPVDASGELVGALRRLRSEPETCAAMGERAREVFANEYSMDRAIARWAELLAMDRPIA